MRTAVVTLGKWNEYLSTYNRREVFMAQFKGSIGGNGGSSVSRLGSKKSGLVVEANGWNLGVRVRAYVDDEGKDCFDVYQTRGSGSWADDKLLASVKSE